MEGKVGRRDAEDPGEGGMIGHTGHTCDSQGLFARVVGYCRVEVSAGQGR